tara:strand:+ start:369 stop:731 length:363 start_codon:yes stop_codon:yes gene_type:complete
MSTVAVSEQTPETPNTIEPLQPEQEQMAKLYWMSMPVICGEQAHVEEYLKHHKFLMANMSVGKENAKPENKIVYYVSYWISEDFTQSIAVVTNMAGTESCMMYKSFGLQWTDPPRLGKDL